MFKKIIMSAAVTTLTFMCMTAFAEFDVSVAVDRDTSEVTVSGCGENEIAGQMLSLYCLREGVSLSDAAYETDETQSTDIIEVIDFTEADKNGNYIFSGLTPKDGSGNYVFYVKAYGMNDAVSSESVYIADRQTVSEFISSVSGRDGNGVLDALLEEERNGTAGAELRLFRLLSANGKREAAKIVAGKTFSKLSEVENAVNDASAQVGILNPADGAALDTFMFPQKNGLDTGLADMISKYNGMEGFAGNSAIKVLNGLNDAERTAVLDNAVKMGYAGSEEMLDSVGICVINYELAHTSGYGDITGIIKSHCSDVLRDLDYNAYAGGEYLNSLNKSLLNMSFESADKLIQYIKEYKPADSESGGGGSGGGLGSSGGGSGSGRGGSMGGGAFSPSDIQKILNPVDGVLFADMTGFEWANDAVLYLYGKGIVSGREKNLFYPGESVTREEFVKMAVVAFAKYNAAAVSGFDDVKNGEWYESFVASAAESGLVRGVSETGFGIGRQITRQDVAVIIARAKNGADIDGGAADADTGFSDNSEIAPYARAAVKWMREKGYINGVGDGSFAPESFCTRAEAAKIIYEAIR